jgi:hypothetical protein
MLLLKKREKVKLENTLTREIRKLEENAQSDQNLIEIEEILDSF